MPARYVIYFLFPKKRNGIYMHTRSRPLKLGSNFREVCFVRRVSTAWLHT